MARRLARARFTGGQQLHGGRRFTIEARSDIPQFIEESLEIVLKPVCGPLRPDDAALRIFDDRLDPLPQSGADLRNPRPNSLVERLTQLARLGLDRRVAVLPPE